MQINRLFEIVYLLMDKKVSTAQQLADYFGVSKRTILRDIDELAAAGIPVSTLQGKGGGVTILDNFVLNKTTFDDQEQKNTLFALQDIAAAEQTGNEHLLAKLRTLFDKTDTAWLEVDLSRWGNALGDKIKFETLKQAIFKKKALLFLYSNIAGDTERRTVYPLKLLYKAKAWYLQAFCLSRREYRVFKVNRMMDITPLPETFAGENYAPPEAVINAGKVQTVHIALKFMPEAAYLAYDEFDAKDIVKSADGSLNVTATLPDDAWLYGYLLSFGPQVQVLGPQHVKEQLLKTAQAIAARYTAN